MSASIRESDNGPSKDEVLKYAPKKTRQTEPVSAADAPPAAGADAAPDAASQQSPAPEQAAPDQGSTPGAAAPRPTPASSEPPWRRSRRGSAGSGRTAFAGDVAIAELRTKLALAPDRLPEPPPPSSHGSMLMWAGRVTGIAVVVAVGFIGYRWGSSPGTRFQPPHPANHARIQLGTPAAPDRSVEDAQDSAGGLPVLNAVPAVYPPPAKANPPPPSGGRTFRQLTVGAVPAQQMDDAAPLVISATEAGVNAAVVIGGLAPGSALSAGRKVTPNTWRVSIEDLPGVSVTPPRGFVGVMDLNLELRLADNSVADRKALQLEWLSPGLAAKPAPRQHDPAEIAQMVKKGADLMANGDVAAARLMYQRAAEAGDAMAAFALAETYDPLALAKGGILPDVVLAQTWYAKARDLGAPQALERLEGLARWDR